MITHSLNRQPHPENWGYCDGLFGRACESPWRTFKEQSEYLCGYLKGQAYANPAYRQYA